jgi:hypothetical protein
LGFWYIPRQEKQGDEKMDDIVRTALVTGCVTLVNGPLLIAILSRKWKRTDELAQLKGDIAQLFKLVDRIGAGLNIGLKNDKVIFEAFRKNSINGESELQDKVMDDYFTECTMSGFKAGKEG